MLTRFVNWFGVLVLRFSDWFGPKLAVWGWELVLWRKKEPEASESILSYFRSRGMEVMSLEEFNRAYPVQTRDLTAPWDFSERN